MKKEILSQQKQKAIRRIQTVALKTIHDFFYDKGFDQLLPVMLSPITDPLGPDPGSSVIKTGKIEYQNQELVLTQSMILHKQIAIGYGIDSLYIVSPNIRLEGPSKSQTGVHSFEFSQVDFEIKNATKDDVFKLMEELLRKIKYDIELNAFNELKLLERQFPEWKSSFSVYTTHELKKKYGENWEKLSSEAETTPYWVTCHKREFYDKLDRTIEGEHYLNYDLYYPEGFTEALSGAVREHEYKHIKERIEADGFDINSYKRYVQLAKEGKLFSSAGGGFGVERLIRYLTGLSSIYEVQVFPRIPGQKIEV